MAEFYTDLSKMKNINRSTEDLCADIDRIEKEVDQVVSKLKVSSSSMNKIKSSIKNASQLVGSERQKLQVLTNALNQAIIAYNNTEKSITDYAINNKINEELSNVLNDIDQTKKKYGLDSNSEYSGDPVNVCNGNYVYEKVCIELETETELRIRIFYNIQNDEGSVLGRGWTHSWGDKIVEEDELIYVVKDDASRNYFYKKGGKYHALPGNQCTLQETDGMYLVEEPEGNKWLFDKSGKLIQKETINSNVIKLIYDDNNRLSQVKDPYNNFFQFEYMDNGENIYIVDHTGRRVVWEIKEGILWSVITPENRKTEYRYNKNGWLYELTNANGKKGLENIYDDQGRTVKQIFPDGGVIQYKYDNNQVTMIEQNGNKVIYEHDEHYRNTKTIYLDGVETFTFDENNNRNSYTDKRGNTSYYEYDKKGNLVSFINAKKDKMELQYTLKNQVQEVRLNDKVLHVSKYDDNNRVISTINPEGYEDRYEYDEKGNPILVTRPDGSCVHMAYDTKGNLIRLTNESGGTTDYEYNDRNQVIRSRDSLNNVTEYAYNDEDELIWTRDGMNNERHYEYDACGNLVRFIDFNGAETHITYNDMNKPVEITNPEGSATKIEYNKMWNIQTLHEPTGATTTYEYDELQRVTRVINALGKEQILEYDACGNLIRRVNEEGAEYRLTYDELNRPIEVIDPIGVKTEAEYDDLGNVLKVKYSDGKEENYQYNLSGKMTQYTDRNGYTKMFSYNELGLLTSIRDEEGILEEYDYYKGGLLKEERYVDGSGKEYKYDLNGNVIELADFNGNIWKFTYDCLGRVSSVEQNNGQMETYTYDPVGNITSVIDKNGNHTRYQYSMSGNLLKVIDALGYETRYEYDSCSRLVSIIQPEQKVINAESVNEFNDGKFRVTKYSRDLLGNVVSICDPAGNITNYQYDNMGRVVGEIDAEGKSAICEYNLDGTIKGYAYPDGRAVKYSYNDLKQLIQIEDWIGKTRISVDTNGKIEKISSSDGKEIQYRWGKRGEQLGIVYPNGDKVDYKYNENMQLVETLYNNISACKYQYYRNGKIKEKQYSDAFSTLYRYHSFGHVAEIIHMNNESILEKFSYSYGSSGKKSDITHFCDGVTDKYHYEYDAVGSLIAVSKNGKLEERYQYDSFGNRVSAIIRGENIKYQYNNANQLILMSNSHGEHTYQYDSRGNLNTEIENGRIIGTFKYNQMDLLEEAKINNQRILYGYDYLGRRVSKDVYNSDKKESSYQYSYELTREYNNLLSIVTSEEEKNVLWDMGLLGYAKGSGTQFCMCDEKMTPSYMVEGNKVYPSAKYDSFGVRILAEKETNELGFSGYRHEGETGLNYVNAREYRPELGRFLSKDVRAGMITVPISLNLYTYCMNDPVNAYDPSGQIAVWLAGGIVGAVVNVGTKVAGDVVNSVKSGKIQVSSWESYVGTATGGFTSGVVFATTGNAAAAGAAGAAVETFTTNGLSMIAGETGYRKEDGYSWKNLIGSTAKDAVAGATTGFAFGAAAKYVKIPGITAGRGSFQAVWKQVMTKAANGQIANVTMRTLGKGLVAYGLVRSVDQIIQKGRKELIEWVKRKGKDTIKAYIDGKTSGTRVETNAKRYLTGNYQNGHCPAEG